MSTIESNAEIMRALLGGWSKYIPYDPSPKQLAFCALPHQEALGGGAAGGGKSAVLLMDALRFTHVPNYAGIIFRRSLTDLKRSGGLLDMAMQWLGPWIGSEITYIPSIHMFRWYNGASLTFGYVGSYTAWEHYQGGSYQFIGWDELTQHSEEDYGEMFSRLRRNSCSIHSANPSPNCNICLSYSELSRVPLRVRGATNPGGRGHFWVKKRFALKKIDNIINPVTQKPGVWVSGNPDRPFIPWFFTDNPGLDQKQYAQTLQQIADDQRRAQLMEGDWDRIANGIFRREWFTKRWEWRSGYYAMLDPTGKPDHSWHEGQVRVFTVVDVACSVRTGVGERSFRQAQGSILPASWTAIGTWGITPKNELLLLDIKRFREESPFIFDALKSTCTQWKPMYVALEVNGPGKPIAQLAFQMGIPIREVITYVDKPSNSAEAQTRARGGGIYLPKDGQSTWLDDFLGEITVWTGHPHETDDQVDVLSNAVHELTRLAGNLDRDGTHLMHMKDLPYVSGMNGKTLHYPTWTDHVWQWD